MASLLYPHLAQAVMAYADGNDTSVSRLVSEADFESDCWRIHALLENGEKVAIAIWTADSGE